MNRGDDILIIYCAFGVKVTKSPLARNNRQVFLVSGYLLRFSSNQLSGMLRDLGVDLGVDVGVDLGVYVGANYNKGIGDAGSTADLRMLWSAIVCLGLGLL